MSGAPSVAVVGPRPLRAEAIASVLERASLRVLRGQAVQDADVLVLDDPGVAEWEQVRALGRPAVALVVQEPAGSGLVELIEAGASAVRTRACAPSELVDTLDRAARGESALTRRQAGLLVEALHARGGPTPESPPPITAREREILLAIEAGLSVKQTALRLAISPRTVENTQRLLFRKLGVRNRSQAVARALDAGLLDVPKPELP
ncbi:MAG: two component transcriptional regulator, LuxR family [Actinomycetia bacterium]|nr:two component transcriptional regulator, LuxR family [Actinomycetes bacterium]